MTSYLQIGRVQLGPPPQWHEGIGDPVTNLGGAAIPAPRQALRHQIDIATYAADGASDTVSDRLRLRRQLRSLLNNTPLKLQSYLYLLYSDDPENSGWYVPDFGQLADLDGSSGLATGVWKLEQVAWIMAGHMRINKEARNIWMKDLRAGLAPRDILRMLYSTDFSALPSLPLSVLPNGVSRATNAVSGQVLAANVLPAGRDGGACSVVSGLPDLACCSYKRAESALNLSDVIVYDRRGQITAPTTGPDTGWEEAYGPDYPWNWLTVGQPNDTPVFDNGLVRVRYAASAGSPGFRVDVWNGTAYVEQGKMCVQRRGDVTGFCDTWVDASLLEYTPDRAVMLCVLVNSADAYSTERVYLTMQRGETGVTFECYPALKADGITQADCALSWTPAPGGGVADLNQSVTKIDSQGSGSWVPGPPAASQNSAPSPAVIAATAGTGAGTGNSGLFSGSFANLGANNFTNSENWVAILRCPTTYNVVGAYQQTLVLQQAANARLAYASDSTAYGVSTDTYQAITVNNPGYLQLQLTFGATATDQINEAESIRSGSGTASQVADATASGGQCVKDTQAAETAITLTKVGTNLLLGRYRILARVKVDSGATGSFRANLGNVTSAVTTTSTSWIWIDLGDSLAPGANPTFFLTAWRSAGGAGAVYVDRVELVLTEDRARGAAIYSGARDAGQAALQDSRMLGALVAR